MLFKRILVSIMLSLGFVSLVHADAIASDGTTTIILRDDAGCPFENVRALIVESEQGRFHPAKVTIDKKDLKACWTEDSGLVLIIDEEGDAGQIPVQVFAPYHGV